MGSDHRFSIKRPHFCTPVILCVHTDTDTGTNVCLFEIPASFLFVCFQLQPKNQKKKINNSKLRLLVLQILYDYPQIINNYCEPCL